MKKALITLALYLASSPTFSAEIPTALTGRAKLSCEALLCLPSGGSGVAECRPSIREYFSIIERRPSRTRRFRLAFLSICPVGDGGATASSTNSKYSDCSFPNPFTIRGGEDCRALASEVIGGTFGNCLSFELNTSACTNFLPGDNEISEFVIFNNGLGTGRTVTLFGICRDDDVGDPVSATQGVSCQNFDSKQVFLDRRF